MQMRLPCGLRRRCTDGRAKGATAQRSTPPASCNPNGARGGIGIRDGLGCAVAAVLEIDTQPSFSKSCARRYPGAG
jgi:hypothetical protein